MLTYAAIAIVFTCMVTLHVRLHKIHVKTGVYTYLLQMSCITHVHVHIPVMTTLYSTCIKQIQQENAEVQKKSYGDEV